MCDGRGGGCDCGWLGRVEQRRISGHEDGRRKQAAVGAVQSPSHCHRGVSHVLRQNSPRIDENQPGAAWLAAVTTPRVLPPNYPCHTSHTSAHARAPAGGLFAVRAGPVAYTASSSHPSLPTWSSRCWNKDCWGMSDVAPGKSSLDFRRDGGYILMRVPSIFACWGAHRHTRPAPSIDDFDAHSSERGLWGTDSDSI